MIFKKLIVIAILGFFVLLAVKCSDREQTQEETTSYLNLSDTVKYIGIETCRQCHADKFETFIHTGMGSSFGPADTLKSIAKLTDTSIIYDPHLNLQYHPGWQNDSLFLREYRLEDGETLYFKNQKVDYVVGSGQHTNSHIYNTNNYLYQVPFTWYSQEGRLGLPPGYEDGNNTRFNRIIGLECMSCHNAMPTDFVKGSENKFLNVPNGIDCERCHGPGEAHLKKILSGDLTDTSNAIDYSIVNPKKLSVELQFEICQRCHLQGNAVLVNDKSFLDFKPGMHLKEIMDVYLPRYSQADDKFIMASHVDRFKLSECFKQSEGYTCTDCHNPHISVRETNIARFNDACKNCHSGGKKHECSAPVNQLEVANFNCVKCHMPSSGSIDIPHVTVHDHYVRKPEEPTDTNGVSKFLGLVAVNNDNPLPRSKALAYLQQYERFESKPFYLDSARVFLNELKPEENLSLWVHYYYLGKKYDKLIQKISRLEGDILNELNHTSYDNKDAWTAYRIGEAFAFSAKWSDADRFYKRAVLLAPYVLNFRNKYGTTLLRLNKLNSAEEQFKKILEENPEHKEALNNLGYCFLLKGDSKVALSYFKKALAQDPDYSLAWLNVANVYLQLKNEVELERALIEVLRIDPGNSQAIALLNQLKNS